MILKKILKKIKMLFSRNKKSNKKRKDNYPMW